MPFLEASSSMPWNNRNYFPWVIAILASLILMTSNGMSISGLSVFDESLLQEFGWNRGELKFRDMVTLGVTGLAAPLMGILIDRYGVRACLLAGWLLLFNWMKKRRELGSVEGRVAP